MAASLLSESHVVLEEYLLNDVQTMKETLESLGAEVNGPVIPLRNTSGLHSQEVPPS